MSVVGLGSIVALLMIFTTGCVRRSQEADFAEDPGELIELQQRLKLLQYRAGVMGTGTYDQLQSAEASLHANEDRVRRLAEERTDLIVFLDELEERFSAARNDVIKERRSRAVGQELGQIVVRDGRSFEQVRIVSVDDAGVSIRHAHGAATLRYSELTSGQQEHFGLIEELATAAEERERQEIAAFEQHIADEMALVREQQKEESFKREPSFRPAPRLAARSTGGFRPSALSEPARRFGSGGYSRYRSSRPTYRYVYYYQPNWRSPCTSPRSSAFVGSVSPVIPSGGTGRPGGGSIRPAPTSASP